ncbi:MAG: hypothetical protein ABII23_00330 [bacterium]
MRILVLVVFCICTAHLYAQTGVGLDLTPSIGEAVSKDKDTKLKNPFTFHLSRHMELDYVELRKLQKRGYGKIELIKLIVIAQKAGVPLKDIIQKRDAFDTIKKIAQAFNVDYTAVRKESRKIKTTIETRVKEVPVTEEEPNILKGDKQ